MDNAHDGWFILLIIWIHAALGKEEVSELGWVLEDSRSR